MPQTRSKTQSSDKDAAQQLNKADFKLAKPRQRPAKGASLEGKNSTIKKPEKTKRPAERLVEAIKKEEEGQTSLRSTTSCAGDIEDLSDSQYKAKKAHWEPLRWMELIDGVRAMRSKKDAPVDTMGCHMCADPTASPKETRFQILISLLLSAQTKDEVNFAACCRLREHGFTPAKLKDTPEEEISKLIFPVGFYKTKAKNIKAVSAICYEKYKSDIPHSIEDLCKLPGIGPKMAYLAMNCAWNETVGIGVDTHVHRLAQRWKWLPKGTTKSPEDTRVQIESWVPSSLWQELNWLLVGFGQTVCLPVKPRCSECNVNHICPSAFKAK
ncbi:endonuclease III-like protein 1 isoform X2 [Varroa jacobsoni]|nr:endonuclease III-like protein 1 isoform X2 [Varroa destructor]XP_022655483.1 endonuclease III-like protein 1 isoform X2 [Varroa destructor]XP_022701846.1 endonuclease III-like protein 1 isoform X2 [Varroa jacobsoni]XP_022701847.1 endonuclease III-like protein 1 isoform X2 [Varroa jacobsoni]